MMRTSVKDLYDAGCLGKWKDSIHEFGVGEGARTLDRRNHNPELCQLSYAHHQGLSEGALPSPSGGNYKEGAALIKYFFVFNAVAFKRWCSSQALISTLHETQTLSFEKTLLKQPFKTAR